ncbi:MAG TPA: type II toxin-antitoxin system RelE/ParE family toxin [Gemmataceae bacterium]|nr:type II toxin-antitoxin system RelE/ParE family toxin [Gemmataceae bacterium]
MSLPLDFHPAVRGEIDAAHDWYEQRRAGLGRDYLDEVERVLAAITANPDRYGFADADIHEGPLRRFPYAIYYRVLPDRIRVLAVYHTARGLSRWQSRV